MTTPFQIVLLAGSWRCGSTVLNLSLIQHPSIFGWPAEGTFFQALRPWAAELDRLAPDQVTPRIANLLAEVCRRSGWHDQPWVLQKNPQDALLISSVVSWCRPARVILLARNPYAICHSILKKDQSLGWACAHLRERYAPLLELRQRRPDLCYVVRYEDLARQPRARLADLLRDVFCVPLDEGCLRWPETRVAWGAGDPDVSGTRSWEAARTEAWRVGLSADEKTHIRDHPDSAWLFEPFGYDPDDDRPAVAS